MAYFPETHQYCVINNTDRPQTTTVRHADGAEAVYELDGSGIAWREV